MLPAQSGAVGTAPKASSAGAAFEPMIRTSSMPKAGSPAWKPTLFTKRKPKRSADCPAKSGSDTVCWVQFGVSRYWPLTKVQLVPPLVL